MATNEGFLTDKQRAMLETASQNVEILSSSPKGLSSSPKSPSGFFAEHQLKVPAAGKAPTAGIAVRHVRRSHSGKFVRVKKGWYKVLFYVNHDFTARSCNMWHKSMYAAIQVGFKLEHAHSN